TNNIKSKPGEISSNTKVALEDAKTNLYDSVKKTLDNVFNKQSGNEKNEVNVLGVTDENIVDNVHEIDLSSQNSLNLDLSVNKKYYLKFKSIPPNYCIYINNN